MTTKEIANNLDQVFQGQPWFGNSLSSFLDQLDPESLNYSVKGGNSIGQILEHMIIWREFAIDKLKHTQSPGDSPARTIDVEDWPMKEYKPADKQAICNKIIANQASLLQLIKGADSDIMHETVPGEKYNFEFLLMGVVFHDVYHLGQLYLLSSAAKRENEKN